MMAVQCLLPLRFLHSNRNNLLGASSRNPQPSFSSFTSKSSPSPSSSSFSGWEEREESRWMREEQRWIREEQRWIREEKRWNSERVSLLREIAVLTTRHQHRDSIEEPKSKHPPVEGEGEGEEDWREAEEDVKEVVFVEEGSGVEARVADAVEEVKEWRTLRVGSEGDDVREMQETLQKLGFYSGEEDMEFSSFSTGTERAVKTWQSSLGIHEDGVMSSQLLERLFTGRVRENEDSQLESDQTVHKLGSLNGATPVVSDTKIAGIQQSLIKDLGSMENDVTKNRVFLLGENRWEEPSRLVKTTKPATSSAKCLTCRGEGRLMCTECDGTGEPNIEPQFMEWVGEETKCPYCEGLGYTICDVCQG